MCICTVRRTRARCLFRRRAYERITKTPKRIAKRRAELESEGYQVQHIVDAPHARLPCMFSVAAERNRCLSLYACPACQQCGLTKPHGMSAACLERELTRSLRCAGVDGGARD